MTGIPRRTLSRRALARVLLLAAVAASALVTGQVTRESDLKAVFLFNFGQYVEWPSEAFASEDTPFIIGFLGSTSIDTALRQVVANETIHKRSVLVRQFSRVEDVGTCHILFISSTETFRLSHILELLRTRPILTVSDIVAFAPQGGAIEFFKEDGKVRLIINNNAAKGARLKVSPRLLKVAARVIDSGALN